MFPPLQADCLPLEPPEKPSPGRVCGADRSSTKGKLLKVCNGHYETSFGVPHYSSGTATDGRNVGRDSSSEDVNQANENSLFPLQ